MPAPHSRQFLFRRGVNWAPLMLAYAFMYMGRYNLTVAKSALGTLMTKQDFADIFAAGSIVYGISFLLSGPITDRLGGRRAMLWGVGGAIVCNVALGYVVWLRSRPGADFNVLTWIFWLYAANMHFQSFGAVAIVTTKAPWFHLHERGLFSTVFGIGITFGVYFAFDWGYDIVRATRANVDPEQLGGWFSIAPLVYKLIGSSGESGTDANWWLFYIPAILMSVTWVMMFLTLRNTPGEAGYTNFDTGEASLSATGERLPIFQAVRAIFAHPVIFWVCMIEFCSGILRNGIMQWFDIFAKETGIKSGAGAFVLAEHWGLTLLVCGIIGANGTGWVSDKFFQSRRAPVSGVFYFSMLVAAVVMFFSVGSENPWPMGIAMMVISSAVIGVHGILSGTATADFGGVRNTGIVVGVVDGLVYLGNGLQSIVIGRLVPEGPAAKDAGEWWLWPVFLVPFALAGFLMTLKIWGALPAPRTPTQRAREAESEHLADLD